MLRKQRTQVLVALAAALAQGGCIWAWSAQALPAEWVPIVQASMALTAALVQAFLPAVTLRPAADAVKKVAAGGLILALLLGAGCSSTQLHVQPGEKEYMLLKTSAPSSVEYYLSGRLRFRRTGDKPLPIRCYRRPDGDRIGPR